MISIIADEYSRLILQISVDRPFASLVATAPLAPGASIAKVTAIAAVTQCSARLDSLVSILQVSFLTLADRVLGRQTVDHVIAHLMHENYTVSPVAAFVACQYANRQPGSFLGPFVSVMETRHLPLGALEFIDLFVTDFSAEKLGLLPGISFFVPTCLAR
jgi:hypothetical protein